MFLFVFFDLPIKSDQDKKSYTLFRRRLRYLGFRFFQNSVYIRDCISHAQAKQYTLRMQGIAPCQGHISILQITEAQMRNMVNLYCTAKPRPKPKPRKQLTLF